MGRTELFYAILVACDILRRGIERAEVLWGGDNYKYWAN